MSVASRLGAAQDGLLAALQTQQAAPGSPLAGVQLTLGWPLDQQAECCFVLDRGRSEQSWSSTGPSVAGHEDEERLELEVRVIVRLSAPEYRAARDRALAIAGEVPEALRADPTLGGAVADSWVASTELDSAVDGESRYVGVSVRVEARAYLA